METGWILPLSYHPKTIIMDPHDPQVVLYWMDYNNVGAEKWTLLTQMWRPIAGGACGGLGGSGLG